MGLSGWMRGPCRCQNRQKLGKIVSVIAISPTLERSKGAEPLHRSGNRASGRTEIVTCRSMLNSFSSGLRTSAQLNPRLSNHDPHADHANNDQSFSLPF
jgi:hypothetical protein